MASTRRRVVIEAMGLSMAFGERQVLDRVDIWVQRNEIVTLIGPNGAGKTTLLRLLLGLQAPDSGVVQRSPELTIGYLPQKISVDSTLPLTVELMLGLTNPVLLGLALGFMFDVAPLLGILVVSVIFALGIAGL